MILQRFYADNFRCLVNFELKMGAVQLLVGVNGAGKTTIFDALDGLRRLVSEAGQCDDIFGRKTRTRWQEVGTQRFELDVADAGSIYKYRLIIEIGTGQSKVSNESLEWDDKLLFSFVDGRIGLFNDQQKAAPSVQFHADWNHSGLSIVAPRPDNTKLTRFKSWIERLRPVQIDPWDMSEQSEKEARFPSRHLDNLADWYRHLQQENGDAVQAAKSDLKEAMPGFLGLNAKQAGSEYREIVGSLEGPDGKPVEVSLMEMSEGQRALIALYLLLHAQLGTGAAMVLDEPENFISLREIQPWLMKAVARAEDGEGQLIVASHHPEILNQLAARDAVVLARSSGGATRVRPFPATDLAPAEVVASGWEDA